MAKSSHSIRIEIGMWKRLIALHGIRRIDGVMSYASRAVGEQLQRDGLDAVAEEALRLRPDAPDTDSDLFTTDSESNA